MIKRQFRDRLEVSEIQEIYRMAREGVPTEEMVNKKCFFCENDRREDRGDMCDGLCEECAERERLF